MIQNGNNQAMHRSGGGRFFEIIVNSRHLVIAVVPLVRAPMKNTFAI